MRECRGKWITIVRKWKETDIPELILVCSDGYMVESLRSNLPRIRKVLEFNFTSYAEGLTMHLIRPGYSKKDPNLKFMMSEPYPSVGIIPRIDDECLTTLACIEYFTVSGGGSFKEGFAKFKKTKLRNSMYRKRYEDLLNILKNHFENGE